MGRGPRNEGGGAAVRTLSRVIKSSPPFVGRLVGEVLYRHFP
jgi:hypothetical protein